MSKRVGPFPGGLHLTALMGPPDDSSNRSGTDRLTYREPMPEEKSAIPALRPTLFEIGDERLPDIGRQRQHVRSPPLAAFDPQRPIPPVDVVEGDPGHLAGTQTEAGHQERHSVVAPALTTRAIEGNQQPLDLLLAQ
jgi:hypothetical protein